MTECSVDGCEKRVVSKGLCDMHRQRLRKHGHLGETRPSDWGTRDAHPLYRTWKGIKDRCYNKRGKDFVNYGARGIRVCDRWLDDFWAFVEDMGPKPKRGYSVDRIDNMGDYTPENCRWASSKEQSRNKRTNVLTQDVANEIRRRAKRGEVAGDIARSMSVHYDHVRHVILNNSWT